jgi:hypothetical protein
VGGAEGSTVERSQGGLGGPVLEERLMIILLWIGSVWFIVAILVSLVVGPLLKRRRVREAKGTGG